MAPPGLRRAGLLVHLPNAPTRRLAQLINEGPFEMVNRGGRNEDKYGRKLRTLERGGRSLGGILVAEGLARQWVGYRRSWCGRPLSFNFQKLKEPGSSIMSAYRPKMVVLPVW